MFDLEIQDTNGNVIRHRIEPGIHRLGKSEECEILLSDPFVSRHHADLVVNIDRAIIKDAGSTNGVWQGAQRIHESLELLPGDVFHIGDLTLSFVNNGWVANPGIEDEVGHGSINAPKREKFAVVPVKIKIESDEIKLFKRLVHVKVLEYLDMHKRAVIHKLSSDELRVEATKAAQEVIHEEELLLPAGIPEKRLIKEIVAEAIGLGPIEPLLDDESVTEIMINGPDHVYVERNGKLEISQSYFNSSSSLMSIIERIVTPLGRRIDEGSPMVDARLPDGSRVNVIIPPLSLIGPVLTIRKFAKHRFDISNLINKGTLSKEMAEFLEVCVKQRRNIMVSGGTGSGKTTTLNVLSNFIPENERIVTIEDAAELQLHQDHVVLLESRPPNIEGKGSVAIRDLVKNALRMRPDRIVIGECRGGEAIDMLQAMNTGHDGSLTTGHANSPRDFLSRLEVMVLMSGIELPVRAIREQISSAVDIILQQTRFSDGKRRITSIVEVDGMEGDVILLQKIFEYKQTGRGPDGSIQGKYSGCGYAPGFYTDLEACGEEMDRSIFGEASELPVEKGPAWEGNDALN